MSRRLVKWRIASISALLLCGCGEREKPAPPAPPEPTPIVEAEQPVAVEVETPLVPVVEPVPVPEVPEPRTRAETLGFARHIPANAEALITFHELASAIPRVKMMRLWEATTSEIPGRPFLAPEAEDDDFSDLQGLLHEDDMFELGPMMSRLEMFGTEVTFALGKGGTERVAAWLNFNRRAAHHQAHSYAATLSGQPNENQTPFSLLTAMFGAFNNPDLYPALLQDRAAMRALDQFQMPPIYLAVRAKGERLREVHEILSEPVKSLANFNEMVAPIEVERAGSTFVGYRLIGADLASSLRDAGEYMEKLFGEDVLDRIIEFLKPREIVALSGIIGDYSVAFFGESVDDFQLAESVEQAITHGDTLAFADPQLAHPLYAMIYGEKELLKTLATNATSLADIALGLRSGFAANDHDGRNRDLVALLQVLSERERNLRVLARHETTGITLVDDGGPRIDAHGGTNGILDFAPPSRFAALGDDPDLAMFLNMSIDARYSTRSTAYKEALFETTYALLMRLMEMPENEEELGLDPFAHIREYAAMFEIDFRGDFVNLWRAIARDMRNGIGRESAIVVDFKGRVPAIPGMPKALVGMENSPRITYLAPVTNHERLSTAWDKIHDSATRIADRVGELEKRKILIPSPISSESGSLLSWHLPLPYFDNEFLPSVTLNDSWFAMGTSRNHAIDLINRLDALEPRSDGSLHLKVNFRLIAASQREQIATLTEHRDAILESEKMDAKEFDSIVEKLTAITSALEEFENLEARCWEEDGIARTRIHLRVKK